MLLNNLDFLLQKCLIYFITLLSLVFLPLVEHSWTNASDINFVYEGITFEPIQYGVRSDSKDSLYCVAALVFIITKIFITSGLSGKATNMTYSKQRTHKVNKEQPSVPKCELLCVECYNRDLMSGNYTTEELMIHEYGRFISFNTLTSGFDQYSTIKLAKSGFYYTGKGTNIKCFCCGLCFSTLPVDTNILEHHKNRSPFCKFVRGVNLSNVPRQHSGTSDGSLVRLSADQTRLCFSAAKYPDYITLTKRMDSYEQWSFLVPTSLELSEAGFFFIGRPDKVRCFECGLGLEDWDAADDPWIEHARHAPNCQHVRRCKGDEFVHLVKLAVIDAENNVAERNEAGVLNAAAQTCIKAGYSEALVKQAVEFSRTNFGVDPSLDVLLECLRVANNDLDADNARENQHDARERVELSRQTLVDLERQLAQLNEESNRLQKEVEELESRIKCKVCFAGEADIVFLPCKHLVCCGTCATQLQICAVCRSNIREKIRVYMS